MKKKVYLWGFIFLFIDLLSKYIIDKTFLLSKTLVIIPKFFMLTKVYNKGASWSILEGHTLLLIVLAIIVFIFLLFYKNKFVENKKNILAFSLLYGGILGNLINRIIHGYVIDFLDFKIINYNYPVFNMADTFIVIGVFLLLIAIIKGEDEHGK